MFLVDDLLMAPGRALGFVFREFARKVQEELLDDESIKKELQEIYTLLDTGKITEKEFEVREGSLLERLEQIARLKFGGGGDHPGPDIALPPEMAIPCAALQMDAGSGLLSDAAPLQVEECSPEIEGPELVSINPERENDRPNSNIEFLRALRPLFNFVSFPASTSTEVIKEEAATAGEEANEKKEDLFAAAIGCGSTVSPAFAISEIEFPELQSVNVSPEVGLPEPIAPAQTRPELASFTSSLPVDPTVEASPPLRPEEPQPITQPDPPAIVPAATVEAPANRKPIQMAEAVESALRGLTVTKLRVSSVISVGRAEGGWRVAVELVERAAVPDSGDLLGVYEVQLDQDATVTRYERTRVRRRNDLSRG